MGRHKHRKKYKFISINGKSVRQHRFIMEQYLKRKLRPQEAIHHKDGDGCNNNLDNLEVLPYNQHCKIESRKNRPAAKLSAEDVHDIRKMLKNHIKQWLIALAFGVHKNTVSDIKTGQCWSWI